MRNEDWKDRRRKQRRMMLESTIRSLRDEAEKGEELAVLTETRSVTAYPEEGSLVGIDGVSFVTDRVALIEGAGMTVEAGTTGEGKKGCECTTYIRLENEGASFFRPDCENDWLSLTLKGEKELEVAIAAFRAVAKILSRQKRIRESE